SDHDPSARRLAVDTIPPVFTSVPNDIAAATGPGATACGTVISDAQLGIAVATDVDPSVVITRTGVPADDAFSVGTTTITFTATDSSGDVATATQLVTVSDDTPPTIVGSATTSPNANGWYRAPVTVHFTCSDNAPGVTCPPDEVLGEGAAQSLTRTATDVAGNTASATVGPVNVDLHAPVIAFGGNAPSYTVDQTVA